jgi:hypothetical protein
LKMSKNMNKRATKRKSTTENSIFKFLTVSSVSSDSIVKGIIDDIIKTADLLRKPHWFVILTAIGWFIVNIQADLFWHRCLERKTFGTPRMYTLSPSKSIKESNYREFHKDNNVLLCTRLYKYAPNLESLLTQQYVCVMCTLWSDNICFYSFS